MSFILSQTELSPSSLGNGLMLNASSLSTTDKLLQLTLWVLSCHKLNFLLVQVDAQRVSSTTELSQFTYLMLNASSLSLLSPSLSPGTLVRSLSLLVMNTLLC
jgi:hypothetical protein